MKQTTKNNLVSFLKKVMLISVVSSIVFAIEVNQEIELTQLLNARYSANFTRHANNLRGQLPSGATAKVVEIKRFSSGNSGFLVEVKTLPPARAGRRQIGQSLVGQRVWVHYNARRPALRLFNADQRQVRNPDQATDATTIREVPVTLDPGSAPSPVAASGDSSAASTDGSLVAVPSVSGTGTVSGTSIPDLVGAANGAVGNLTGGGDSGCRDCSGPSLVGGTGNSGGPSDTTSVTPTVSGSTTVVPAPDTIPPGIQLSIGDDGSVTARVRCTYPSTYRSHAGSLAISIERSRVTYLDARIDNGNCRISTDTFSQVDMGNGNIVMRDQNGCTVSINTIEKSTRPDGTPTAGPVVNRANARLTFGVVQVAGGGCERLCSKVAEGRGFWQVETNPTTGACE
jgi:hypothetical protein